MGAGQLCSMIPERGIYRVQDSFLGGVIPYLYLYCVCMIRFGADMGRVQGKEALNTPEE